MTDSKTVAGEALAAASDVTPPPAPGDSVEVSLDAMEKAARRRLKAAINRSAGQHLRQMRAAWERAA